jgi:hypothetical protein
MAVNPTPAGTPPTSARGRPAEYFPALEEIKNAGTNDWWILATFDSTNGAKHAKSRIATGKTTIPDPNPDATWEFRVVRYPEQTRSELWVKHE